MNSKNKAAAEKKFNELREHAQQWSAEEHKRVQAEIHFERCEAAEAWCQSTWRSRCEKSHPELRRSMTERQWKSYCAMWYEEMRKGFEDDVDSETYEEEQRTGKFVDWNHPPATSMLRPGGLRIGQDKESEARPDNTIDEAVSVQAARLWES